MGPTTPLTAATMEKCSKMGIRDALLEILKGLSGRASFVVRVGGYNLG